jgi:glycosyltransferase involved in cell wall biosynthesis
VLVTGDLSVLSRWSECYRKRFRRLLDDVSVEILPYRGIEHLFETYGQADVVISPRFLDNSYNLGHTEWKVTLGMACGCLAIASPVPSYQTVFDRSSDGEIVICSTSADWVAAFDALLVGGISKETRKLSTQLVDQYYSSEVLAKDHCRVVGQQFVDSSH